MQDRETRAAILQLHTKGHGTGWIARALKVSRGTVKRVIRSGTEEVPDMEREEKAEQHETLIRELHTACQGNLVRVYEELSAQGIVLAYSTLTGFCRRRGIGQKPKQRVGRYDFEPGQEMQHDTSPHKVMIGSRMRTVQCASLVLCYSRMMFAQVYPRWTRFWAKVFLTDAIRFFGGAAGRCMLDNSSIIVVRGTGKNAIMATEMVAFAERFGSVFEAHELGDTNRSARVERPFSYIEGNFYPGRHFESVADLNTQLHRWCERANGLPKRTIQAKPIELFPIEQGSLRPLPPYVPEVYALWTRTVDSEGYVVLHTNTYSAPETHIDHEVSVREGRDWVRIFDKKRLLCEHKREEPGQHKRCTLPEHERKARRKAEGKERPALPQEPLLRGSSPALCAMVEALKKRHGGRAKRPLLRLHRMWLDYPQAPLDSALRVALDHGLLDLERVEAIVLRHVAGDFFRLPTNEDDIKEPE
jgi:transposase